MSSSGPLSVASGEMARPGRASTPSRWATISISPSSVRTWMRVDSADVAVLDVLALGTEVEVLHPPELRAAVREAAAGIAARHTGPEDDQ